MRRAVIIAVVAAAWASPSALGAPDFPPVSPIVYPADNPSLGVVVPLWRECFESGCQETTAPPVVTQGNVVVAGGREYCYDGSGPVCYPIRATYTYPDGREVPLRVGVTDGTSLVGGYEVVPGGPSAEVRWEGEARPYYSTFENAPFTWLEGEGSVQGLCVWSPAQNGFFPYPPGQSIIGLRDPEDSQHVWYGTIQLAGFMPLCQSAWLQECGQYNCYAYPSPGCPVIDYPYTPGLPGHCPGISPPCPDNALCPAPLNSNRPNAIAVTPDSGIEPLEVSVSVNNPPSSVHDCRTWSCPRYYFDFGDDSGLVGPQESPTAPHTYTAAGTYTVTVTASYTEFWTDSITVTVGTPEGGTTSLHRVPYATTWLASQTVFAPRTATATRRTKVAWGQLWRARDTVRVYRNGRVILRDYLGTRPRGYNAWVWRHSSLRRGRYVVRVCGAGSGYRYCRTVKKFRRA